MSTKNGRSIVLRICSNNQTLHRQIHKEKFASAAEVDVRSKYAEQNNSSRKISNFGPCWVHGWVNLINKCSCQKFRKMVYRYFLYGETKGAVIHKFRITQKGIKFSSKNLCRPIYGVRLSRLSHIFK